jgi:anti-sigma regulatory factor (Ser/Thr protein kinase)
MTGPRADSPVTTEVSYPAPGDLIVGSSPESRWQASTSLPAPPLAGSAPCPALYAVPTPATQPTATCALEPRPESVRTSRDFARAALREWDMPLLTEAAELVVSELVTNALRHGVPSARRLAGEHPVRLKLLAQAPFVMCMVSDPGAEIPVLREPDLASESGRGLRVVEACSVRWGWHLLDEGGKIVWALLR